LTNIMSKTLNYKVGNKEYLLLKPFTEKKMVSKTVKS
jgi:hypothetical protein